MEVPTKAKLDELAGRSTPSVQAPSPVFSDGPPGMPDPEPDILVAAQAILTGMIKGQGFSEVVDELRGQRIAGASAAPLVDEQLKLQFLAHVLENQPYERTYSLLGGKLTLTFQAVTADIDRKIAVEVQSATGVSQDKLSRSTRDMQYSYGLLAASLQRITLNGVAVPTMQQLKDSSWIERFNQWASALDRPLLQLIYRAFRRFEQELEEMLSKANDPSFWPTL